MPTPTIHDLDHLVLTVADVERSAAFYSEVLGLAVQRFGPDKQRVALVFGNRKINLHPAAAPFSPHARLPTPGSADLCFLLRTPLDDAVQHLQQCGVEIIEGPVERTGAQGRLLSIYCRDPDGNLLELAVKEG